MKPLAPIHPAPLPPYDPPDLLDTDAQLGEGEKALRAEIRAWVERRLMPRISALYFAGEFPADIVPEMGAMGMLGPTTPVEYGGPGRSYTEYGIVMQELERCDKIGRAHV